MLADVFCIDVCCMDVDNATVEIWSAHKGVKDIFGHRRHCVCLFRGPKQSNLHLTCRIGPRFKEAHKNENILLSITINHRSSLNLKKTFVEKLINFVLF